MANYFFIARRARRCAGVAAAALAFVLFTLAAADKNYTVKHNDTLTDLAHKYGLTVGELAGRNGLARTDKLRVGQKLVIPDAETAKNEAASSSLLPKELNRIRVERAKWKYIVIHHSASPNATVKGMDYYHLGEGQMENGRASHFDVRDAHQRKRAENASGRRCPARVSG